MTKKGIVAVLVVLVLIIAGGIWYYESETQSMTSSTTPPATQPSAPAASSSVSYTNNEYGFTVTLPADWQGYTIVTSTWTGNATTTVQGPIISIRNPLWTSSTPTQDIPIMVFTLSEWSAVASGTMPVSAAPIPPSELGRNAQYVFALPARYNYAYPQGWQEVQTIIQGDPLQAF